MIVEIPAVFDIRHKAWAKHVTKVDTRLQSGYAFGGRFLTMGAKADLPEGAYVLVYEERGSMKRWDAHVDLYRVAEGALQPTGVRAQVPMGRMWALEVRDAVTKLVNEEAADDA